jgi:hypothetical protein
MILYYPGNIDIQLNRVDPAADGRGQGVERVRRIRYLDCAKAVTPARAKICEHDDSAYAAGASRLVVSP